MVHIYVSKTDLNLFRQKLKDFLKFDDYIIDGERLGKKRVVFPQVIKPLTFINDLFPHLPDDSIIVFETQPKTSHYFLCIGEVRIEDINHVKKLKIIPSTLVKTKNKARITLWVPYSHLEEIHKSSFIQKLSTIKGNLASEFFCKISFQPHYETHLLKAVTTYTSLYTLKKNEIFVKLSISFFCHLYKDLGKGIVEVDILQQGYF